MKAKKLISVLICALACICLVSVVAYADGDFNSGGNANAFNWYSGSLPTEDLSYTAGDGTITWTAATHTLTLTNATVTASTVQISFPSSEKTYIYIVLEGDNYFTGSTSAIQTGGCIVTISGSGNLTMQNTTSGFSVQKGGVLNFLGTGKINVAGTGTTALNIMSGGSANIASGDVTFSTSNGFGKAIDIQSNASLTIDGGMVNAIVNSTSTDSNVGGICCYDSTSSIKINAGTVNVTSPTVGISIKSATRIGGTATVNVSAGTKAAIGGAAITITDNAKVNAVSTSNAALSGATEISGNANVYAEGGTYGISGMFGIPFTISGNPTIIAKGGNHALNISTSVNTAGYAVVVGTDKTGTGAAPWDLTTSFTKYGNEYKYVYIGACNHLGASDDGDCTTAVVCPTCGKVITAAYESHDVRAWISNGDSTCTADGTKSGVCARCGKTATVPDPGSMLPHMTIHVSPVEETCTTGGNIEYWRCLSCGKYFSDEACTTEITSGDTIITARGHKLTATDANAATCTTDGNIAYWYCSDCGKYYSDAMCSNEITYDQTIITAPGHSLKKVEAKAATCTVNGNIEYWYCTACGKCFTDSECTNEIAYEDTIIPATGHKAAVKNVIPATCELDGNAGDLYCSVCGQLLSTNNIIPKLGHSFLDGKCVVCGAIDPSYVSPDAPDEGEEIVIEEPVEGGISLTTSDSVSSTSSDKAVITLIAIALISAAAVVVGKVRA